jgi:circadian clock protein KaiC
MTSDQSSDPDMASTGVRGLDSILHGGLPRADMHLLQGTAGTGKTTIALCFLRRGASDGEATLYLTLSQSKRQLERIAQSHGWSLDGVTVHELSPSTLAERMAAEQTILPVSEVELIELLHDLEDVVKRLRPRRAVIDSITVLELLSGSPARYHHEVVSLRQLFIEHDCTVLALADHPAENAQGQTPEVMIHPLSGCVINLQQEARAYGDVRRSIRIVKSRGIPHNGGYHDLKIRRGLIEIYARLGAYVQPESRAYSLLPCGVASLDRVLGGGLNTGTSCLIVGASGVGKSSLATLFATQSARAGQRVAIYLFDERPQTYIERSERTGMRVRPEIEAGRLIVEQLDPGEIAPGEFAQALCHQIEHCQVKVIVLDSIIGYFAAMGAADVLLTQLHELMTYLTRRDVLLLMCGAQEGFMSIGTQTAIDVSYLSDTVISMAFYEVEGELRRAVAVVKKKYGSCLTTIHQLRLDEHGLSASEDPLREQHNLLVPSTTPQNG